MARPGPKRGQLHVGRYFLALLALFVALYSTVVFDGSHGHALKPKLGLDLKGGAQVTLTPKSVNGKKVTSSQLKAAVEILRNRVNGAGVSNAEVVIQGSSIVVSVPGGNRDSVAKVTQASQMEFRKVVQALVATPQVTTTQTAIPSTSAAPTTATSAKPTTAATPKASAPVNKRPLSAALAPAAASPSATPKAAPSATQKATPSATPSATSTATPVATPSVSASPTPYKGPVSGDVYSAAAFAALDCTNPQVRAGGSAPDQPTKEIMACDRTGTEKFELAPAEVLGKDVKGASVGNDPTTGQVLVSLSFKGSGQDKWTKMTQETLTGSAHPSPTDEIAITLDGVVLTAPVTQSVIYGDAQISGSFTQSEGEDLANNLKFGALPVSFNAGNTEVVSASLGSDQLHSGLLAGGIGLIAVVIYSLLYYRMLGFVTIASLLVSGGLVYGSICVLGSQLGLSLSLAGIAGFIVSVGITADSFVVYFERLKDEIKEGRSPRSAVDRGWVRAQRTIINADIVSLIAAVVLYFVTVGDVRGFAFTLGLSTILDLVVVFLFTRPLISFLSRFRWFSKSKLTGFYGPDGGDPSITGAARPALAAKPAGGLS